MTGEEARAAAAARVRAHAARVATAQVSPSTPPLAGVTLAGFPFNTTGRIVAPVLITRLHDGPSQQLAVMCFDGFLYVVDGATACAGATAC